MTPSDLKLQLSDPIAVARDPFNLLKHLVAAFNKGEENICRELTFYALESRTAFGEHQQILQSLVRELGLFPYVSEETLGLNDSIAYEYHRPVDFDEPIVFHREQAEVFRRLLDGDNIILSAPTSFGKSKVIDAIVASGRYKNIVVIVPTIALIDETRRRLSRFSARFKLVTQQSQEPAEQNIFVFTAERAVGYEKFPHVDFFVIDEFYKIGALSEDPKRTVALNHAFYKLVKGGAQFYLLGPCVREIPAGFEERFRCRFYPTSFATVASEVIRVQQSPENLKALAELVASLAGEPTLIFCKSPKRVNQVVGALLEANINSPSSLLESGTKWMQQNFHPDWILPRAISSGIGLHHGRLPRSLGQFVVRAFNDERLNVLACTSTLIEGVNTKAKNVIILDNTIAKQKYDFFTFNNIKGRSGRMFQHFVGRVFLFHDPPTEELPFVDFPIFSQGSDAPDSILVQLDDNDLSSDARIRLEPFKNQKVLPLEIIKKHSSIEPSDMISLAMRLQGASENEKRLLRWTYPTWEALLLVCELSWEHLLKRRGGAGVFSGRQLAMRTSKLRNTPDIRRRISDELIPGQYAAESADEAVERVLEFDRTWASFELPRTLRAFSDIRRHVHGGSETYAVYASELENLFREPFQVALEEFGLPIQLTNKFAPLLQKSATIEDAIETIRSLNPVDFGFDEFEKELLADCKVTL
jgi:hypothetical protein